MQTYLSLYIRRLMIQTNLTKAMLTTAEEIEDNLIVATKNFSDFKKRANDLHATHTTQGN